MAKIKEYPKIITELINDLLKGNFNQVNSKLNKVCCYALDKSLNDNTLRYFLWQKNRSAKQTILCIDNDIKFAIIYFCDKFNEKSYNNFLKKLEEQSFTNFKVFVYNKNIINEIISENYSHICFVEQNDLLHKDALNSLAVSIHNNKDLEIIYTDEDIINNFGIRVNPYFKTDCAYLMLLSHNYMSALLCLKLTKKITDYIKTLEELNQQTLYRLVLDLTRNNSNIEHIDDVLYHRNPQNAKKIEKTDTRSIIFNEIAETNLNADIYEYPVKKFNQVKFYPDGNPKISILIPFKDKLSLLKKCIHSIESKSLYKNYEIIMINNRSAENETLEYLKNTTHKVLDADIDFNFSKLNNMGAEIASGEYLLFLNNDTEVISPDWLESMLGLAQLPQIGAVGAKLLYPNNTIQHAGIVTRQNGTNHVFRYLNKKKSGYRNYLDFIREYSCLTGACIMVSKEKYFEVGGFTEELIVEWNDIDFTLKLIKAGYFNLYCPFSVLYHYEKASRSKNFKSSRQQEIDYIKSVWGNTFSNDPFYNSNFSGKGDGFTIKIN